MQHQIVPGHPLEDVRQWQKAETRIAATERNLDRACHHVGVDVVMGEHHALRLTGRARGVDDGRQLVAAHRVGRFAICGNRAGRLRRCAFGLHLGNRQIDTGVSRRPEADDGAECGTFGTNPLDFRGLLGCRNEDCRRTAIAKDVGRLLRREVGVERYVRECGSEAGVVGDRPLGPILGQNRDAVATLRA